MGGCANSKYAVDEDTKNKQGASGDEKVKNKKPFLNIKKFNVKNGNVKKEEAGPVQAAAGVEEAATTKNGDVTGNKEEIEFIDHEKTGAAAAAAAAGTTTTTTTTNKEEENEDAKKEVTTYQTTVVKHTQKEGDELLQHLKDEAFRTLQNSLKHLNSNTTRTTTASAGESGSPQTTVEDAQSAAQSAEELIAQVKNQVVTVLGRVKQDEIGSIVDTGVSLIRESKVKSMTELEAELEKAFSNETDLVKKVVNATTGFLTAKGTEAGALLSNILANANQGIQGVMNETEKTTVKVTRTITEQVLSGGQIKEVTRVITEPALNPPPSTLTDILKNLTADKQVKQGTQVSQSSTQQTEEHEAVSSSTSVELKEKAEKVVNKAVEAAVEKLADQQTSQHDESLQQENIKVEEESTVRTSTTKIILNGDGDVANEHLNNVQAEFFKTGKLEAEEAVNKIDDVSNSHEPADQPTDKPADKSTVLPDTDVAQVTAN